MNFEMFKYKEDAISELAKDENSFKYPNKMQFFKGIKISIENVNDIQEYDRVIMEFRKLDFLIKNGARAPNGILFQYQKNPIQSFLITDSKLTKDSQQRMLDMFDLSFYVVGNDAHNDKDIENDSESNECCKCCNCRIC